MSLLRKGPAVDDDDLKSVIAWLEDELEAKHVDEQQNTQTYQVATSYSAPKRPRTGMVVYADGVKWNPGEGEGLYIYHSDGTWTQNIQRNGPNIEMFGAKDGGGADANLAAIFRALDSIRQNPKVDIDTFGGDIITIYQSGRIYVGGGVFRVPPDALQLTQDMGTELIGAGPRGTTFGFFGRTTLLIAGSSAGWGIRVHRGGARSGRLTNMSICYEDSGFTGDLIDIVDSPGWGISDCYLGTFGITGGTRLVTPQSLLRITYDENTLIERCILSGAVNGIWLDDTRVELGNTGFGGWGFEWRNSISYDLVGTHFLQTGARRRTGLKISNVAINPINERPVRGIDISNTQGAEISNVSFIAGAVARPTTEWLRLDSCTAEVSTCTFGETAKAGTLQGNGAVDISKNFIYTNQTELLSGVSIFPGGVDGFRITGGMATGKGNRFFGATQAWRVQPDGVNQIVLGLGPDRFDPGVTTSFWGVSDSALATGEYVYSTELDFSTSKFENNCSRISIANPDRGEFSITGAAYNVSRLDSGRRLRADGAADQVFTMLSPVVGTRFTIFKPSSHKLTIQLPGGTFFYVGVGAAKTQIVFAAADVGGSVELEAYSTNGWKATTYGTVTIT